MPSFLFIRLALIKKDRFKCFCKPKKDGQIGVSCLGGIAIYLAFLIAILTAYILRQMISLKLLALVFSSGLILILGAIDDLKDLRPSVKIIVELLTTIILISSGIVTKIMFLPTWANILVTILWVLFITNAFNLLDIMDGLASGLIIIISSTLFFISCINGDIISGYILLALSGAHLGFLKYNYPPAKIYMGDAGSLFSGFLLAATAINISYASLERPVALIAPILALSLPIYDTLFLIIMRLKKKRPIFNKTKDHFALRLNTMGHSVRKCIWIMYLFNIFLAVLSLILAFSSNVTGIIMLIVTILVFILMGKKVGVVKVE